jgi:hypothetical protein
MLSVEDKIFLISFEEGDPQWEKSAYSDFRHFSSVQWKLLNISKLKTQNPAKHRLEMERLKRFLGIE